MIPRTVSVGPLANASATNILTASRPAAGAITMNGSLVTGGVAVLDKPRRILVTTNDDETSNTIVFTGTNWTGQTISETLKLASSSTSYTALDYATVTSAVIASQPGSNITIGTNSVASSPWVYLDPWALAQSAVQTVVTGTVNYDVQTTLDDPNNPSNPVAMASMTWLGSLDTNVVGATASKSSYFAYTPVYTRILLNSGGGTVTATFAQSGVVGR